MVFAIDYVNFEQDLAEAGNFKTSAEAPQNVDDLGIPGIPGTTSSTDNIAAEALTFLEIPAPGVYTMVVNSDDGFQVSAGTTNTPVQLVLGKFDGGRGATDSQFYFKVDKAGVYFFRLLWFEGGSGANVEWFTVNSDGGRALVGGSQAGALKAYRVRTVSEPSGSTGGGITSFSLTGGKLVINFTGTLSSATSVLGPFQPVPAASPYQADLTDQARFFLAQ
jgi:hypothetical protein